MSARRLIAAPLLLALIAATAVQLTTPAPAGAQANVCPEPERTVDPADPAIVVTTPQPGASVTSPVTIAGEAAVFEANVIIRIFDAQGNEIVNTFTTALEAGPTMAPFSTQVSFNVATTQPGCIWVSDEAADETMPEQVVAIPVTLVAPATTGQFAVTPHPGGVTITMYTGTLAQLAADGTALNLVSCWATVDGAFVGYVFGAPPFVNAAFTAQFAGGLNETGLICRRR